MNATNKKPDWSCRLEYVGPNSDNQSGKSQKFWQVEVYDKVVVRRWGRIGTAGQTDRKVYRSYTLAMTEAEYQARKKHDKGYTRPVDIISFIGAYFAEMA